MKELREEIGGVGQLHGDQRRIHAAIQHECVKKRGKGDQNGGDVAQVADLSGKLAKAELEGAWSRLYLNLP